jgi:hypothetical protein
MSRSTQSRKEERIMTFVKLSTASQDITFESLAMAEIYGMENIKQNCCIVSKCGKVLSFKRKGDAAFTRITKRADICE